VPWLKDPSSGQPWSLWGRERAPTDEPVLIFRSHAFRRALILLSAAALTLAAPSGASAVTGLDASLDGGSFSEFSQTNALNGTLSLNESQVFDGRASARATYEGNGENGYARGIWNVNWQDGESVWFGAAYYLPAGFLANVQGQVDLMRWDNWSLYPSEADWGGVSIYGSDHRARLLRFGAGRPNDTLVGPTTLPEGRWFTLEVHQVRSSQSGSALSELYVDGKLIGKSTAPNTYGRPATRVRFGLVAIAAGVQTKPLQLNFDEAAVGATPSARLIGQPEPEPEPAPTPEPQPEPTPTPESKPTLETVPAPGPSPGPAPEGSTSPPPATERHHGHVKRTKRVSPKGRAGAKPRPRNPGSHTSVHKH
jgi:hypothetical protein